MNLEPEKATDSSPQDGVRLSDAEKQRQAKRSRAIGFAIAGLCLLFYVITVFKMGPSVLNRSM